MARKLRITNIQHDMLKANLARRVQEYMAAREAHKTTVNVPAPMEDPVVMQIAEAGGMAQVELEIIEDDTPRGGTAPNLVSPNIFRQSFTYEERCTIELAAAERLKKGDASLRVLWDDINTLSTVNVDSDLVTRFFQLLDADKAIAKGREATLRKRKPDGA